MKKIYVLMAILFATSVTLMAQTDVTSTYLTNAGFDEAPTIFTLAAGGKISNADTDYRITRIDGGSGSGWRFIVTGWDETSYIKSNAVQISTAEYGFTTVPTLANSGLNTTTPPATQKDGVTTTGACLHMSAGWGDKAIISKAVALQSGKYKLFYDAYNANTTASSTGIATNFCGYSNGITKVVGSLKTFPQYTWKTDSVTFTILSEADNDTINIGFTTSSGGSGNGAKLYIDNVKLLYYGIDKTDLKLLIDSATVMFNHPVDVGASTTYADLNTSIQAAQVVYINVSATAAQIVEQETALKAAIENVYGAITLQTRKTTWTTFPYDATSAIINPSFESGFTGWTNVGGFQTQSNTSFDPKKVGTYYAEKWVTSGTALTNLRLTQFIKNIPNGIYLVKASAHAIEQTGPVYPGGAYIFASADIAEVFAINDYSVQTTVTDNVLEIGYEITTTGNWVAVDNFQLTYVSDGSPYMLINPTALAFTPSTNSKTINVKGGNLTNDISLTPTSSFSLSKTTITAAEAMAEGGVDVEVTCSASSPVTNDSLIFTSGALLQKVMLTSTESPVNISTKGIFRDQSYIIPDTVTVSGDFFSNVVITAPAGISLSESVITPAEALTGKTIIITWNTTTQILEKSIVLSTGATKDSILVFAVSDNIISTWDGDNAEVAPSKMTDFGWDQTLADGVTPGTVVFNEYNVTGGSRYVPAVNAAHTYRGKTWKGHRVAYLRSWGSPATNVYNLAVNLEADKTYVFRGVSGWHNNETNPTFTYSVNTAKANLGTTLGTQSVACTVKQRGEDYGFEFTPTTTATHYLTVSSNTVNDAMCGIDFLAIYPKLQSTNGIENNGLSNSMVYPTVTNGSVNVKLSEKSGQINVYDVAGRMVVSKSVNAFFETINLPSTGIYLVEIKNANISKTFKVIKVN